MCNKDILPNTNMSRDNFNLRVNTSAGPVDFDFTANYTREKVKNRPALGDSQSNVGKNLMTLAGTYDQAWLKHLDAFSAYPNQTRIPSGAPGGTTGKPEVCPSRSSRTSDGTTQNSCAHDR